ncbi:hypothetical protein V1498_03585 [Peribacillus sp. SCS-26]|uniref:hypothetical protein n=1 Tax=Paraperibacillus marinus TaxID=3115295 RepID=UPI0039058E88
MQSEAFTHFYQAIQTLEAGNLDKQDLLTPRFLIEKEAELALYYAPHNEWVNREARVVIAGITPGWYQMKTAFEAARAGMELEMELNELLQHTKRSARFAGTMRKNLIEMLDGCGLPEHIGLSGAGELFGTRDDLLHTTSIIKYPVFKNGQNYTGHSPAVYQSALLKKYAYEAFPKELNSLQSKVLLLIPLGKAVGEVIRHLQENHIIPSVPCLFGFPHPSGANGHRKKQFEEQKESFMKIIEHAFRTK